jgi:hypothetical protein
MTRAEYDDIIKLHKEGISFVRACRLLNIPYHTFCNVHFRNDDCSDEKKGKLINPSKRFKWTKELNNELLQLMSFNRLNFQKAFRIFGEDHSIDTNTVSHYWYFKLKKIVPESICEAVGSDHLVYRNVKNAFERCPVKQKFIKETTPQMRELHNIPIFDSTINWSFQYIYYK